MSAIFNLDQLINMMSIGTLLAYTIVATSVLILRYEEEVSVQLPAKPVPETGYSVAKQTFNLLGIKQPTQLSANIAKCSIFILFLLALATCTLMRWEHDGPGLDAALGTLGAGLIVLLVILYRQPRLSVKDLAFTVPLVPLVPYLSVCMNLYLMVQLDYETWIRFSIWLVIGYLIYFGYGIRNSSLNKTQADTTTTSNGKDHTNCKELSNGKEYANGTLEKKHITTKF
ncbi:probable cationic amino acid transporter [Hyposmocoma kahamanoa]|uniref:probable cationic amino acid transporter n=1 Tax=Hyposmocoma kahamanoa TaxID=1477025 RepID=UPI000E6DA1B4|nr:probable cationic amino acid transporter [Hyposmocoma kahamanoa]